MQNLEDKRDDIALGERFKTLVDCPKTGSTIIRKTLELCFWRCAECDNCEVLAKAMSAQGITREEGRAYRQEVGSGREPVAAVPQQSEAVDEEEPIAVAAEARPAKRKLRTKKFEPRKRGGPLGLKEENGENRTQPVAAHTQKPEAKEGQPQAKEGKAKPPPPTAVHPVLMGHKTVPVDTIKLDESLYPRAEMIEENIERLQGLDGCFKDKIVVSEDMILVDGGHRVEALKRDGITEVEVLIYKYLSEAALLRHAVQLNCEHGYQLSKEEKRSWVRKAWAPDTTAESLARIVGVAERTIQTWTSDLRKKAVQQRDTAIRELRDAGVPVKEAAQELKVSESAVKRAVQKRTAAELTPLTEQDDQAHGDETAVDSSADHTDGILHADVETGREDPGVLIRSELTEMTARVENMLTLCADTPAAPFLKEKLEDVLRTLREADRACEEFEDRGQQISGDEVQ